LLHFIVAVSAVVLPSVASASAASGSDGDDGRGVGPLIVGGDSVAISDVPWQVSILQAHLDPADDSGFFDQFCGGSVIAATWVVTAAHCVFDGDGELLRPIDIEVAAGYAQLSESQVRRGASCAHRRASRLRPHWI
jgi:secreted trypsin-like serine protease